MENLNKKRVKKFNVFSTIFLIILLMTFVIILVPNIIFSILMISQTGWTTGMIYNFAFFWGIVLFIAVFVFLVIREMKRHKREAEIADEIESQYKNTLNNEKENK